MHKKLEKAKKSPEKFHQFPIVFKIPSVYFPENWICDDKGGVATGIKDATAEKSLQVVKSGAGSVSIISDREADVEIVTIDGRVTRVHVSAGESEICLGRGLYIICGKKMAL